MSWNLHVGQKVVCVDVRDCYLPLKEGAIYTITEIGAFDNFFHVPTQKTVSGIGVRLDGISTSQFEWIDASRFRPFVARTTDISLFKAMLNPSKQKVRA